ncbi:hypothetical protein D3C74_43700 [compost metagenome]
MFGLGKKQESSITTSIPTSSTVHGITVRKLPIGQYLKALHIAENLPEIIMKECFPAMKPLEVLDQLKNVDEQALYSLVSRLIRVVPEQFLRLVAELIEADYEHLINELTPKELLDVLLAFWKANDLTDFFGILKKILPTSSPLNPLSTGYKK